MRGEKNTRAVCARAAVGQGLREGEHIAHTGDHARAAAVVFRAERMPRGLGYGHGFARRVVIAELRRDARELLGRGMVRAVFHAQRREDVFAHVIGKARLGNGFHQRGEHIVAQAVLPMRTWLKIQRFLRDGPRDFPRGRPAAAFLHGFLDGRGLQIVIESWRTW